MTPDPLIHPENGSLVSSQYLQDLLTQFYRSYMLYKIRDTRGHRLEDVGDYISTGKESYTIVSAFKQFEYRHDAHFFRKMADEFERCVFELNLVKQDFAGMQQQSYVGVRDLLV